MLHTVTQQPTQPNAGMLANSYNESETEKRRIKTRFGEVEVSAEAPITFQQGLLGIAGNTQYALTDLPSEKLANFKLLQSLNDDKVSFITMPLALDNELIEKEDLEKACADIGILDVKDLAVLLVVSVHRSPQDIKLSANVRAPLLVHTPTRQAVQYVFQNSKYDVRTNL